MAKGKGKRNLFLFFIVAQPARRYNRKKAKIRFFYEHKIVWAACEKKKTPQPGCEVFRKKPVKGRTRLC